MQVRLVTKTTGALGTEYSNHPIDDIIVGIARLSSSRDTNTLFDSPSRLLRHCLLNGHWSIFEMANLTFEIKTSRAIGRELLRHGTHVGLQEFCITGDSLLSLSYAKKGGVHKKTIKELYENQSSGVGNSNYKIKSYNTNYGRFFYSDIKEVFYNGLKPVYNVLLEDGKKIKCTKEHKFFNGKEFLPLEEIVNLIVNTDKTVRSFIPAPVATNGIEIYKDKDKLSELKFESINNGLGVQFIADQCGVSYHTIRKWLKRLNLSFSKKEVSQYTPIWNKGKSGYKLSKRSMESRLKQSLTTPKGEKHHAYRGGGRTERCLIQAYINAKRDIIYSMNNGASCVECGKKDCKLELHHVEEVTRNPYRAYDLTNIQPLCFDCHKKVHKILSKISYKTIYDLEEFDWESVRPFDYKDYPKLRYRGKKYLSTETIKISKVVDISFAGFEECYDLETVNENHNYVANSILVHNSQRYAEATIFESVELRRQSKSNRQSSTERVGFITEDTFGIEVDATKEVRLSEAIEDGYLALDKSQYAYERLLEWGVAKECARFVLPETTQTTLIMNFRIRELITMLNVRLHKTAQKEVRLVAEAIRDIFIQECPLIAAALHNFHNAYEVHILDQLVLEKHGFKNEVVISS